MFSNHTLIVSSAMQYGWFRTNLSFLDLIASELLSFRWHFLKCSNYLQADISIRDLELTMLHCLHHFPITRKCFFKMCRVKNNVSFPLNHPGASLRRCLQKLNNNISFRMNARGRLFAFYNGAKWIFVNIILVCRKVWIMKMRLPRKTHRALLCKMQVTNFKTVLTSRLRDLLLRHVLALCFLVIDFAWRCLVMWQIATCWWLTAQIYAFTFYEFKVHCTWNRKFEHNTSHIRMRIKLRIFSWKYGAVEQSLMLPIVFHY